MKSFTTLMLLFSFLNCSIFAQSFSSDNPDYIKNVKAGEAALKSEKYDSCLVYYQEAFTIKQKSYLSLMRAAACAYKADNTQLLNAYLDRAFEIDWVFARQILDYYDEFKMFKGSAFEEQVHATYLAAAKKNGINVPLMEELAQIKYTDQEHRKKMSKINKEYGWQSPQMDSLWALQNHADSVNTLRIEEIIAQYGYPGKSLVGKAQASTAFLVIQHGDLAIQEKYLPLLTEAANKDELSWRSLALLIDRVKMGNGEKQIYGSQLKTDPETGKEYFALIENPHKIDSIRATVGLGPIQKYADHWSLTWDADKHIEFHKKRAAVNKEK